MALIICPECGRQISDKADVCIGCGFPISSILKNKTEQNSKYFYINVDNVKYKKRKWRYFHLVGIFPDQLLNFDNKGRLGTGLTEPNANWLQEEFRRADAITSIGVDEECTSPNLEVNQYIDEERQGLIHCPYCKSTAVTTGARGVSWTRGFIGANKTVNRCSNCGETWVPGEE